MPDLDPREPTTTTTTTTTDQKNSSASKPSPSSPSSRARKESRHDVVGVNSNDLKQPTPKASSTTTTGAEEGGGKKSTAGEERGKAENPGPKQPSSSSSPQIHARTTSKTTTIDKSTIAAAAHSDEDEEDGGTEESAASKDLTDQSHEESASAAEDDTGPLVDMETFGQLLEMDDDEEHSFSKSLTWDYFDQAVTTFKEMDAAVLGGDLITLSRKGHFLKGSSAALGLNRVKASCEKMQHYGNRKRANGEGALSESEAMHRCKNLLNQLKEEQKLSKAWLERFYAERNV